MHSKLKWPYIPAYNISIHTHTTLVHVTGGVGNVEGMLDFEVTKP
jgi:hypothetical protein